MKKYIVFLALLFTKSIWAQDWYHVGPTAAAGSQFVPERVQCIAINSFYNDSMYCASRGGLWVSSNAGSSWREMDPNNNMSLYSGATSIVIGPTSHHVYIAATDIDNSISDSRIWVYDNSTASWSTLGSIASGQFEINNIQFYPGNENTIYACTSIGLYRTTNHGGSWTQCGPVTNVYNIVFATIGATTYSYISGNKIFYESTNGVTFTAAPPSVFSSLFSMYTNILGNICIGNQTSSSFDIYFYASCYNSGTTDASACYQIIKYNNTSGTESAIAYFAVHEYDNSPDRLALGYTNNGGGYLWFGGVGLYALSYANYTATNSLTAISNTGNTVGLLNPHSDQHYVLDAPGLSTIFFGCDGGFSYMSYSTFSLTVAPSSSNMNWSNTGLDIAQINGFSGAGSDTTLYVTGEQDRNGEIYDFSTTAQVKNPGYWENAGGLVDKFDNDTVLYDPINGNHYWVSGDGGTSFGGDECTYEPTSPTNMAPGTADCELAPWGTNSFFQDPSRPSKMYYGTNYLNQLDQGLFVVKMRPSVTFGIPWSPAQILGGAISPIYKNGFYVYTTNRVYAAPDTESAYVIKFIGPDIDNCWAGNNENTTNWQLIFPNYRGVYAGTPWNYTFAESDLLNIHIGAMAVSTWNPNKIWIACAPTSKYPLLKVMQYDGTNWTDYSTGIPSGDVAMSLVMEIGTNDGMYLGTNRAIYYRNATMSSWVVFNNGPLPEVLMSQLEINYYENKLRVGTYGRGIWESSFECPSNSTLTLTTSSASEFDEAIQSITSTANIASSSTVYYRAGQDVILNQGFYAVPGSNFYAFVHPCSGSGNSMIDGPEGGPTSVENIVKAVQDEDYRIAVYPNPNGGKFTVQLPEDGLSEVHVYNLLGSEIYTGTGLSKQVEINLGEQPRGIYFVRAIETKTGEIDVKKIMIQ